MIKIKYTFFSVVVLFTIITGTFSCKPLVHLYTVQPMTITADDSVFVSWSVRGKATLLTHTIPASVDPDNPQPETREYTLVVAKKGKEIKRTVIVDVRDLHSADDIVFTTLRKGDTLLAEGEKDIKKWGNHFLLQSVMTGSDRDLAVSHAGKMATLNADGSPSMVFNGVPNSGKWEIRCLLTAAEKQDSSRIPGKLRIHTILLYSKQ
ncbi:MAG: hypothetical protein ABJB86_04210 [Bacteroidota bacterium]